MTAEREIELAENPLQSLVDVQDAEVEPTHRKITGHQEDGGDQCEQEDRARAAARLWRPCGGQ